MRTLGEFHFGGQWDLISQDWGNRDSPLEGNEQNIACTKNQGKGGATPLEAEPDPPASAEGSPAET